MPTTSRSGKRLGQDIEGDAVGRIIECRDEHQSVGDVEVGIAGRQPLALEDNRPGHGQLDDAERLSVLVARRLQAAEVVLERLVVRVVGARLDDRDHGSRPDEPRQVVDMAVGVVALDSPSQPDDVTDSEIVGEDLLESRAIEAGVASLDLAEQTFLGRKQRAPAVDIDRAPFHHDRVVGLPCLRRAASIAAARASARSCEGGGCRGGGCRIWPSR